ncbi:hypothetical protein [Cellulosilyticum sp. I15G10I2]|uniref:hypothetical protein n=1 Tax=Cellulosilyticum sp. I15G10I2 TaxID=1892843 RepID=UPI00085CD91B|nr:hypothetical protein [Cellulosilyticum sp. I15G10I2]
MSAFLGKIHYWLYNKVLWHEELLEEIIKFAATKNVPVEAVKADIYNKYGQPDFSPLEEVIDHGNIHGWLQSRIQSVEYRIAAVITELINKYDIKIEEISEIYKNNGIKAAKVVPAEVNQPQDLFTLIFDFMLAGMPCDRVHETVSDTQAEFTWQTTRCLHKEYWDAVGGDINHYYLLQDAWILGFVKTIDQGYSFIRSADGLRSIRKG